MNINYNGTARYSFTSPQKEEVFYKFGGRCADCGLLLAGEWHNGWAGNCQNLIFSIHNAHIHHIIPISEGGKHKIGNWILLCIKCHHRQHKGLNTNYAPTGGMRGCYA